MRTEKEMYDLVLNIGKDDPAIRAIYMNGSRTNPTAKKDIFQDYDLVYVVDDTLPFIKNEKWINNFGNILYMQYPDGRPDKIEDNQPFYGWLMMFDDGNRIDLHVETINHAKARIMDDTLCEILLDKDQLFNDVMANSLRKWYVKKPSLDDFLRCCNEFWWCTNNLCKGLWREEITYVEDMANFHVRKELEKLLGWKASIDNKEPISVGKSSKYLYKWLDKNDYEKYLSTFFEADINKAWESIFIMTNLFEKIERYIAEKLNFIIEEKDIKGARKYMNRVFTLPKDAKEIF